MFVCVSRSMETSRWCQLNGASCWAVGFYVMMIIISTQKRLLTGFLTLMVADDTRADDMVKLSLFDGKFQ